MVKTVIFPLVSQERLHIDGFTYDFNRGNQGEKGNLIVDFFVPHNLYGIVHDLIDHGFTGLPRRHVLIASIVPESLLLNFRSDQTGLLCKGEVLLIFFLASHLSKLVSARVPTITPK